MKCKIRELAQSKFPTLTAFYKAADITSAALRKWERNGLRKAQLGVMVRIANVLDCDVTDLYEV